MLKTGVLGKAESIGGKLSSFGDTDFILGYLQKKKEAVTPFGAKVVMTPQLPLLEDLAMWGLVDPSL